MWRLPFGKQGEPWPPMPADRRADYPALADRFADLERELLPAFLEYDRRALAHQRTYRRFQIALIVGAALTSFFGALQATLGDDGRWVGAIVALLGASGTLLANQLRKERLPARYLEERAKAEELRALHFAYLGGVGIAGVRELEMRVADIEHPKKAAEQADGDER